MEKIVQSNKIDVKLANDTVEFLLDQKDEIRKGVDEETWKRVLRHVVEFELRFAEPVVMPCAAGVDVVSRKSERLETPLPVARLVSEGVISTDDQAQLGALFDQFAGDYLQREARGLYCIRGGPYVKLDPPAELERHWLVDLYAIFSHMNARNFAANWLYSCIQSNLDLTTHDDLDPNQCSNLILTTINSSLFGNLEKDKEDKEDKEGEKDKEEEEEEDESYEEDDDEDDDEDDEEDESVDEDDVEDEKVDVTFDKDQTKILGIVQKLHAYMPDPENYEDHFKRTLGLMNSQVYGPWFPWGSPPLGEVLKVYMKYRDTPDEDLTTSEASLFNHMHSILTLFSKNSDENSDEKSE